MSLPNTQRSAPRRALLSLDPELGRLLAPERFARARLELQVPVVGLSDSARWAERTDPAGAGLLIVQGALLRLLLSDGITVTSELLGPGDLVRPVALERDPGLFETEVRWEAVTPVAAAVLGRQATERLGQWPEIHTVLLDRANERAHRLALNQAIGQLTGVDRRVLALLWHLAGRFGRVTPDGVLLPLPLSHRRLGELIGARRPTVSTALAGLTREGSVTRLADATWLLLGTAPLRIDAEAVAGPA
jgi:CRP/FNR family transcriptional regulator, cyclic AMP receptor protein